MPEVVDSIDSEVQIVEIYNEHFRDPIPMPCGFGWGFRVCHLRLKERMQRIKMSDFPIASSCLHSCPESGNV